MNELASQRKRHGERGIALMMTLGIVALVLIMAMSFSYTARTEREAAGAGSDQMRARLLAEAGLERAIATVQYGFRINDGGSPEKVGGTSYLPNCFPRTKASGFRMSDWDGYKVLGSIDPFHSSGYGVERLEGLDGLGTTFTDRRGSSWKEWDFVDADLTANDDSDANTPVSGDGFKDGTGTGSDIFGWNDITAREVDTRDLDGDGDKTDAVQRLIGRVSYLLIDESAGMDPTAVQNDAGSEGTSTAETERAGDSVEEMKLAGLVNKIGESGTYYTAGDFYDDMDPTKGRTFSWENFYRGSDIDATNMPHATPQLRPFSIPEPVSAREMLHQYDLSQITSLPTQPSHAQVEAVRTGIPWLANWSDTNKGTFADGAARARQIAANLIDYIDDTSSGGSGSADDHKCTWADDDGDSYPDYMGIEQVPFINELRLKMQSTSVQNPPASGRWDFSFDIAAKVEMVNMFKRSAGSGCTLTVNYDWYMQYRATPGGWKRWPTGSGTRSGTIAAWTGSASDFSEAYAVSDASTLSTCTGATNKKSNGRSRLYVTITSVILQDSSGNVWDCARMDYPRNASNNPLLLSFFNPGGGVIIKYARAEVNDPRQNHNEGDWQWVQRNASASGGYDNTTGNKNSICEPDPGGDKDVEPDATGSHPWLVSSAYTRNKPVEHLSELGIVHRAAPWETLNLIKYRSDGGVGGYASGDRNMLDGVRLGSVLEEPYTQRAKVNINTDQNTVLEALFSGLRPGDDTYAPSDSSTSVFTTDDLSKLITAVKNATGAGGTGKPLTGPVDIMESLGNYFYSARTTDLSGMNDRDLEVALLHTAALVSGTYNYFTAIVLAQSVKDIPLKITDSDGSAANRGDDSGDEVGYGYYDNQAVVDDDTGDTAIVADSIVGEQKVVAQIARNALDGGLSSNFMDMRSGAGETFTFLGKCPSTGHRYYLSTSAVSWLEAKRMCETNGGNLVTLNTAKEMEWLGKVLLAAGFSSDFWLGLYRVGDPSVKDWAWVTDETYSGSAANWDAGEPTGSSTSGPSADSAVATAKLDTSPNPDTCKWSDTAFFTGGNPATPAIQRFVLECEPVVRVVRYEYKDE